MLSTADIVWNRACQGGGDSPCRGDTALASLLLFHGAAMNGGVLHAVGCLSVEQRAHAKDGFRYFGFASVEDVITRGETVPSESVDIGNIAATLDSEYCAVIPSDSTLVERFEEHFARTPSEFSQVE